MKAYYTIFLINEGTLNFQGVAASTVNTSEFLLSKGYPVYHTHVNLIVEGTMERELIIRKHLVKESSLLTPELLLRLRKDGEKEAKKILKSRMK